MSGGSRRYAHSCLAVRRVHKLFKASVRVATAGRTDVRPALRLARPKTISWSRKRVALLRSLILPNGASGPHPTEIEGEQG